MKNYIVGVLLIIKYVKFVILKLIWAESKEIRSV